MLLALLGFPVLISLIGDLFADIGLRLSIALHGGLNILLGHEAVVIIAEDDILCPGLGQHPVKKNIGFVSLGPVGTHGGSTPGAGDSADGGMVV